MSDCLTTIDASLNHAKNFLEQFKQKGVSFCGLYHHEVVDSCRQVNAQLVNEINELPNNADAPPTRLHRQRLNVHWPTFSLTQKTMLTKFAFKNRELFDLVQWQELLLGMFYVYPKEKRIFKLFPKVLRIDATLGTNDEK
jgi:hypothetical protein